MRYGVEAAIRGIIAIACEDEDPRNRIRATELLGKYSLGERVEVDQDIAPAIVLMIAEKPGDPGWPSIASVEPLSASDMIPVER